MQERPDPLSKEGVKAMFAVVQGTPAADAWLDYVRARHPDAVDLLAKAAMTDIALELLVSNGDITIEQAREQRTEAAEAAAEMLPRNAWKEILELRDTLEMLEADVTRIDDDVVDLSDAVAHEHSRAS